MSKTKKRTISKPKPMIPIRAGVTLNPKRKAGYGGKVKKVK